MADKVIFCAGMRCMERALKVELVQILVGNGKPSSDSGTSHRLSSIFIHRIRRFRDRPPESISSILLILNILSNFEVELA